MPYRFNVSRRHSHQFGSGNVVLGTAKPATISEAVLNAIPGGLAWGSLLIVLWAAIEIPLGMIFIASLLSIYTAVRFSFAGAAVLYGLRLIKRDESTDWLAEYHKRADEYSIPLEKVHHLVIIPNYREDEEVLCETLDALAQQAVAQQTTIMLAMESGEPDAAAKGQRLRALFADTFAHFFVEVHPKGLHQEMQCKSANESWATRHAKSELVDRLGYDINHIVVTTMDADTVWHPQYLQALGVMFATDEKRYNAFWQAPIRYHSNVWDINPFMRLVHAYSTCWELAYLAAPWWPALPMSSYSLSLKLLDSTEYWDPDVIADEWHMYIKAFFAKDGDLVLRPIFLPFMGNATGGYNFWHAIKERYDQTVRHAWGAKEIGYTIAQIQNHPQVDRRQGFHLLFRVAHDNLLAGAGWVILTLGTQLPALLHPGSINEWTSTIPFILLQVSFGLVTLLSILFWWVDVRTRPPRPRPMTRLERLQSAISLPMLPTVTLVCVAIPVMVSQTRLMLGLPLKFRVTRKVFAQ